MFGKIFERVYIRPSNPRYITLQCNPEPEKPSFTVRIEDYYDWDDKGEPYYVKVVYEDSNFREAVEAFLEAISNASEEWSRNRPR